MIEAPQQFLVLGLPVHLLDNYLHWLKARLDRGLGNHVVTLNAEMAIQAESHDVLRHIIRQAELVIPDGSGIIFYLWLQGQRQQRCPGIELAEALLQQAAEWGEVCPVFFYGGKPEVVQQAANAWQQQLPNLAIAGIEHGYLSAPEEQNLKERLERIQPKLILVGLGVPRQEVWIAQNRHLCPQATWIGVGGSFDIWSGGKTRAPVWLQKWHLEWLYRLYQEPWRWRRMAALPKFALKALAQRWSMLKYLTF